MNHRNRLLACLMLAFCLGAGSAQADEVSDALKGLFKGLRKKESAPVQPAAPVAPVSPAAPTPPAGQESPGDLLLKSLMSGKTSPEEELRIGQQIAGNLVGVAPLVRDDALQRYVNQVGRWVALQSERADLEWRFGVIESEDLNAFAAPGGFVFLTKGLYRRLNSESELAGVLGHEIGHVVKKHQLKLLQKSQAVAALGGLISRRAKNSPEVLQNLIGNGAEMVARGLDKDAEFEADRLGLVYAARSGYEAYGLPTVLAEIGHSAKGDARVSLLYKTHPHPEERLGQLSEAVGSRMDGVTDGQTGDHRFYRLR